jgi:benzylsuccinate CoA-transferase BbsF subunit
VTYSLLEGLRVLELGQFLSAPYCGKLLADMGAEVIRLESCHRSDTYRSDAVYRNDNSGEFWNRGANFYEQNRNKLGVTLDLNQAEGLSILKELIAVSDIFAENFTPRVIKHFGLEYDDLRQIKPDTIMLSPTGYGYTGPWSGFGATGPATEAASGLAHMTGYVDGPPVRAEIPHTDFTAAEHTVFAVMAALVHRLRTGQGQFLDISHTQIASSTLPEALMDFAVNGRTESRMGNGHPAMAPHGCYPCRGDDRWIVIAVADDERWLALCEVLGQPGLGQDSRFKEGLSRWRNRGEVDRLVGEATRDRDAHELMQALQAAGVPAGAVLDSHDLLFDPHLMERKFFEVVSHHPATGIPPLPYGSRPWKLLGTPAVKPVAAPTMGEDNGRVLSGLLGRTEEEMSALEAKGVIGYAPTKPRPVNRPPMDEQVRQGRLLRYDADFHEQVARAYPE